MKKFKKSIEISTENISDVLQVPIVTSVYKTKFFKNPFIEGRSNPYDALTNVRLQILITAALRIPMLSGRATEDVAFLSRFRVRRLCR